MIQIKKNIKLAVFDMAGTTIKDNSNVAEAFQEAFLIHGFGQVTLEEAQEKMGYPKPMAIRDILGKHVSNSFEIRDELVDAIHTSFVSSMMAYYRDSEGIAPTEDAEEVFRELQKLGIIIGLDTGFSRDIADVILERVGWKNTPLLDITVCSDEVENGRPYPDMIHTMMEMFDIMDPQEVIKIGDTEVDVNQGLNTGCLMSIAVTTGAFEREELSKHHPTHIINSLKEILPLVKSHILAVAESNQEKPGSII
jgi:phosphonatase-like hydrolase